MKLHPPNASALGPRRRGSFLLRAGLPLLGAGAAIDFGHHAGVPVLASEPLEYAGHLVTLAGMAVTALAVGLAGLRRR